MEITNEQKLMMLKMKKDDVKKDIQILKKRFKQMIGNMEKEILDIQEEIEYITNIENNSLHIRDKEKCRRCNEKNCWCN